MTSAVDYQTVTDGNPIYPTVILEDADGNRLTPSTITFVYVVGSSTTQLTATVTLVEAGSYRAEIDTTGMGGNWLWGDWMTGTPYVTVDSWQGYVARRNSNQ